MAFVKSLLHSSRTYSSVCRLSCCPIPFQLLLTTNFIPTWSLPTSFVPHVVNPYHHHPFPVLLPPPTLHKTPPLLIKRPLILQPRPIPLHTNNLLPIIIRHRILHTATRRIHPILPNPLEKIPLLTPQLRHPCLSPQLPSVHQLEDCAAD